MQNQLPTIPQNPYRLPNTTFSFGQGSWETPFAPDPGLIQRLMGGIQKGDVNFDQAVSQIINSSPDMRTRVGLGGASNEIKKSLVQGFGDQPFVGPEGQTGYFNQQNYGFIPQTTKNVISRVGGMGPTTEVKALQSPIAGLKLPPAPTLKV